MLGAIGAFSVNYVFDKMIGNQILSQLELEIMPDDFIEDNGDTDQEKEVEEAVEIEEGKENGKDNTNKSSEKGNITSGNSKEKQQFTTERLKEIQDDFSTVDKLKVMSMLTSKLSMNEIKGLTSIASGGVDKNELNSIKSTLKDKLNEKDVEYLKGLYKKYN